MVFNSDDAFQRPGGATCDARFGVKVGEQVFILGFEGFERSEAREATEDDLMDADFHLEMEYCEWQDMLSNIKENGHADLLHTLNSLDPQRAPGGLARSKTDDGYRLGLFLRYNQTFQYYFDASSRIDTVFQSPDT